MLVVDRLVRRFGDRVVLNGVDLVLGPGQAAALLLLAVLVGVQVWLNA